MNWENKIAVVICAGPSLSDDQLKTVAMAKDAKTITVNTAYQYFLNANAVYAGDFMFWKVHGNRVRAQCPASQLWTCDGSAAERFRLNRQKAGNREGLGKDVIHMNGNSGFQAINLAYLWGARRILVLGMDMREIDGEKHRHGDHEKGMVQAQQFEEWKHKGIKFADELAAAGCDVANCTPGSALTVFRSGVIEEELA